MKGDVYHVVKENRRRRWKMKILVLKAGLLKDKAEL